MAIVLRSARLGGIMLAALSNPNDPKAVERLRLLRSEGVTDTDIRNWWNLTDAQRAELKHADVASRATLRLIRKDLGDSEEDATEYALRNLPLYGHPDDTRGDLLQGDDRPLPDELAPRVDMWAARHHLSGCWTTALGNGRYPSINACIRANIRSGRL